MLVFIFIQTVVYLRRLHNPQIYFIARNCDTWTMSMHYQAHVTFYISNEVIVSYDTQKIRGKLHKYKWELCTRIMTEDMRLSNLSCDTTTASSLLDSTDPRIFHDEKNFTGDFIPLSRVPVFQSYFGSHSDRPCAVCPVPSAVCSQLSAVCAVCCL